MTVMSSSTSSGERLMQALGTIGAVVAPVTLLSSLMLYFGWIRTAALFGYFGVDPAILGFSVQDYALRTVGVAFQPIIFLLLAMLVAAVLARIADWLYEITSNHPVKLGGTLRLSPIAVMELAVGILLLWSSLQTALSFSDVLGVAKAIGLHDPLRAAVALAASALILMHATRRLTINGKRPRTLTSQLVKGVAMATVIFGLFWATAVTAQSSGERLARFINEQPSAQARVTIFSKQPLELLQSNEDLAVRGPAAEPSFRYIDLRLLIYSNARWFLLTRERSESGRLKVAIIRDAEDIGVRVEAT